MQTPIILVLEDTVERIEWLRKAVKGQGRVVWARGVTSFRKLYTLLQNDLRLIILDHDLGLSRVDAFTFNPVTGLYTHHYDPCSGGPKGLDGRNAASWLGTFGWEIPCPIWVWSWNYDGAGEMTRLLALGKTRVVLRQPFEANRKDNEMLDGLLGRMSDA